MSKINNKQIENAKDIGAVINMYSLIECSGNYSPTCGGLWWYYRDQPALNDDGNIINFPANDDTSLSYK